MRIAARACDTAPCGERVRTTGGAPGSRSRPLGREPRGPSDRARRRRTRPAAGRRCRPRAPARVEQPRELDPAVGERAAVDGDDRRRVARRAHREAADVGVEGVERRRLGAGQRPRPRGHRARRVGRHPRGEHPLVARAPACAVADVEQVRRREPRASPAHGACARRARARGRRRPSPTRAVARVALEARRGGDREQPLLRVGPRLALHPALEAEARVPVEHARRASSSRTATRSTQARRSAHVGSSGSGACPPAAPSS